MSTKVLAHKKIKFCPICATELKEKKVDERVRLVCPACNWIHYLNPVPVAACLVLNRQGDILMVKRGVAPQKGRWALPAGFMEIDENPDKAALRELKEETGIKGKIKKLIGVYRQPSENYTAVLTFGYKIEVVGGELVAGDDAQEVKFRKAEAVKEIPFKSHRRIIEEELGI